MIDLESFRNIGLEDTDLLEKSFLHNKFFKDNGIVTLRDLLVKERDGKIIYTLNPQINKMVMAFINLCKLKYLGIPIDMGIDPWGRHHYTFWTEERNIRRITYLGFDIKKVIEIALEVFASRDVCSVEENSSFKEDNFISLAEILMNDDVLASFGNLNISDEEMNRISLVFYYLKDTLDNVDILECQDISLLKAKRRELLETEKELGLERRLISRRIKNLNDGASI